MANNQGNTVQLQVNLVQDIPLVVDFGNLV